ncbi:Hypothetical protein SMAX5B_015872 [Scophthalmus maximus]|uniref:Uncharacterized protein n=1 Tax=Scophthalmus maximus TaxID=52904 RepID=A0A2U9CZJ2_SCOMX|nr:Hypothetical protein SMAX5B_015872 [Scophthalmus maximus]
MDFPVEATVHLHVFRDETKVRELLRSHDFVVTDLDRQRVCVKGSFLKLKAAKARLEELLNSQNQAEPAAQSSSSPVSSGAISRYRTDNSPVSGGDRGRAGSRDKPPQASPSSPGTSASWSNTSYGHSTSSKYRAPLSPGADQSASFRRGQESFVVDADVFRYARRLRKKDIDTILENHNVEIAAREFADSCTVTLLGKSARTAAGKLQSLLDNLSKSLRTQEVPLKDMDREGRALLKRPQRDSAYNSVLVCEMNDRLRLIGSSGQTYELKQKLLGAPAGQSRRAAGTFEKGPGRRSSSLPPASRRNPGREGGAAANPSPVAGYSPSKYQDDRQEGAKPEREAGAGAARSGARRRPKASKGEERPGGFVRETENKSKPPGFKGLLVCTKDIKQMFKDLRK